jgi:hypothetical protein
MHVLTCIHTFAAFQVYQHFLIALEPGQCVGIHSLWVGVSLSQNYNQCIILVFMAEGVVSKIVTSGVIKCEIIFIFSVRWLMINNRTCMSHIFIVFL